MLKQLWLSVRSNPYFVAFEGGVSGAAINYLYDAATSGQLDFSKEGLHKLIVAAVSGGLLAVKLLYRPAPGAPPTQSK